MLTNPAICSRNSHVSITLVSLSPSSLISSGRGMKPQWGQVGKWGTVDNVYMSPEISPQGPIRVKRTDHV
jgi:hypothetical protein